MDVAALPSIQTPGPYQFARQTLALTDSRRNNRPVPTDLYIPDFKGNLPASIPVVVFSHGLGETPTFAAKFLEDLASYGFVVAAPDHIGSDKAQQERLASGTEHEIFRLSEFYERPQDVSFVLDTLEQKNATQFGGRLNLNQVGVVGHSFGAYTVLVLGGATVDFKQLRQECQQDYVLQSLNIALLLQCRALELESSPQATLLTSGQLRDPRVKSALSVSPVTHAILGPVGMSHVQIPVALFGGGKDPVAPLVPEQIDAFNWLKILDKYLIISSDLSHTPEITELVGRVVLPGEMTEDLDEQLAIFLRNFRGVGLAFMQVYTAGREEYRPYLTASYTQTLNAPPFNLSLIRTFPPDQLERFLNQLH